MKKLPIVVLTVLLLTGYSYAQDAAKVEAAAPQAEDSFVLADKLLAKIVLIYQNYFRGMFDMSIAADAPGRVDLVNQVDRDVNAGKVLELNYFINEAIFDAGQKTLAVTFKWEKRTQPKGARAPVLSKGQGTFVFKKQANGDWLLYQVNGENPL